MPRVLFRFMAVSFLSFAFRPFLPAQNLSSSDQKHDGNILIQSCVISGTRAIDSTELAEITNSMASSEFNNDLDELGERIRAQFQDRGYFQVEVQKVDVKVLDPLASPKPVSLEAQVSEGPLCRLSTLEFGGYRALTAEELRAEFPIKLGDVFARSKIASGLQSMQALYGSRGFLDFNVIPDVQFASGSTAKLILSIKEGQQYRMDKLRISGPPEAAEKLQIEWKLAPGAVFDSSYVKTFVEANSSLLPPDFTQADGVELIKNCPEAKVSVYLKLVQDSQQAAPGQAKSVQCSASDKE